jgi:hypothetical protein
MTTTTSADLGLLRARMTAAIGGRMAGHMKRLDWGPAQLAGLQRARLRALLARAIDRSPFHAARLAGIDPARFELADLAQLPIMTKAQMMGRFGEIVTDRRLTRDQVDRHLAASEAEPALLFGDYVCLVSGGSSGLRGVFVQTAEEYAEFVASVNRRAMAAFLDSGGDPADGQVIGIVAAASPVHSRAWPRRWPPARRCGWFPLGHPADGHDRNCSTQPSHPPDRARDQATSWPGAERGRLRLRLRAVTSISRCSPPGTGAISAAFGVPVINMFVSTEGSSATVSPGGQV